MMVLAYVTAGVGIVLLVVVLLAVLPRLRRFSRAAADLRSGLATGTAALPAIRAGGGEPRATRSRTPGDDLVRKDPARPGGVDSGRN